MDPPRAPRVELPFAPVGENPTPWHERRMWQITPVRDAFWIVTIAAIAVLAIWFGYELRAIFTPILIALALAYLFDPIISTAHRRWRVPRPVTVVLIVIVLLGVVAGLGAWLGPKLAEQVTQLAQKMPDYWGRLANRLGIDPDSVDFEALKEMAKEPGKVLADKAGVLIASTGRAVGFIGDMIGTTMLLTVTIALVPLYFFFFAWHFGPLTEYFKQYLPRTRRERALEIFRRMDRIVATYFRARVVIALIMGVLLSIGWGWAGVPYWLLLGMGSGLLSLIPYASTIGWPLAVGLKWLDVTTGMDATGFSWAAVVIWPSVVYAVVQFVESAVLTPYIQGRSLDMSVVTILIVVFIGGAVGGLYGLLLCIPLAACIKVLLAELVLPRIKQWAAEN